MTIAVKIYNSYRIVVALCDSNLIGKKFEEGKRQLHLRENFYKEREVTKEEAINYLNQENSRHIAQITDGDRINGVNLENVLINSMNKRLEEYFSDDNNSELNLFIISFIALFLKSFAPHWVS